MANHELEKFYDIMHPGWDAEELSFKPHYRLYAKDRTEKHGLITEAGESFKCHLCGEDDRWQFENENVFVCEHEPIWVGRGSIRQISSIPTKLISVYEILLEGGNDGQNTDESSDERRGGGR